MFFLKIAAYQSTPKILYVLQGTKEKTKRNQETEEKPKNFPPLPIFPNSLFIKIDPWGI
jgi:hypothetical protein